MVGKTYGFCAQRGMGYGYCRPMGYGMQSPANQVGGQTGLWDIRGYGLQGYGLRGVRLYYELHLFGVVHRMPYRNDGR